MATTGSYILHKSSQLCTAVRTNVNLEDQKFLELPPFKAKFQFPDGAATLPPRLHLSSLTLAVKQFCHKVRTKGQRRNQGWRSLLVAVTRNDFGCTEVDDYEVHSFSFNTTPVEENTVCENCRENQNDDICSPISAFPWALERITDQELLR